MYPLVPDEVTAVVPCHRQPADGLLDRLTAELPRVVVVCDGLPIEAAPALERFSRQSGAEVLRLGRNWGKGHAIAVAIRWLRHSPASSKGVLVVDADGQHPPGAVPEFLSASLAGELVIGNRFAGGGRIPPVRRACNQLSSRLVALTSGASVPDSQCGMRLLHGRALTKVEFPGGGMESETRHLKRCLRARVPVAWVPIPAIYEGQPSSFRPLRDSFRVLRAAITYDA